MTRIPPTNRLTAVATGLMLLLGCQGGSSPLATRGQVDLSGHDLTGEPVRLDGEWEFYWDQLLSPEDFQAGRIQAPPAFARLPSSWSGFEVDGAELPGTGKATFRLRVRTGGRAGLALRMFDLCSAWRLWGDGTLLGQSGEVGTSLETEVPSWSNQVVGLPDSSEPVELVLQISNFHKTDGGIVTPILLGSEAHLQVDQSRQWATAHLFVGILLMMGLYHLVLFAFRRKDAAPLAFGLYCLLWMGNYFAANSSGWAVRVQLPSLPSLALEQFAVGCFVVSVPVGFWFFRCLYPEQFSERLLRIASWVAAAAVGTLVVAPAWSMRLALPLYYGWSLLLIAYCFRGLGQALLQRRTGAGFILVGFAFLGIIAANDMLYDLQLIRSTYLIHVGMVVYVFFQALALAQRFSRSFSEIESLSVRLEASNCAQQQEMAERARLENEIVNISEEERRRVSHDLHDGLCQLLTGARLQCRVLEAKVGDSGGATDELAKISSLLDQAVGDAYDLSRGLWPVEENAQATSSFLEGLAERLSSSSGVAIGFEQNLACSDCAAGRLTHLSRIGQEAVVNAVRHSKAKRIEISLECTHGCDQLCLTVKDDGVGRAAADPSRGGLGLRIMAHRAKLIDGSLSVADAEGGGTVIACTAPCRRKDGGD